MIVQQQSHTFSGALAECSENHAPIRLVLGGNVVAQSIKNVDIGLGSFGSKITSLSAREIDGIGIRRRGKRRKHAAHAVCQPSIPRYRIQEHALGWDRFIDRGPIVGIIQRLDPRVVVVSYLLQPFIPRYKAAVIQGYDASVDKIEQSFQFVMK